MIRFWTPCAAITLSAVMLGGGAGTVRAQTPGNGRLDVILQSQHVTKGLGDWSGIATRLLLTPSARDTWYGEAVYQKAFKDEGVYAGIAERHALSDRWSSYLALGSGTGDFVLPDLRADAQLAYVWGVGRRVVTTLGGTFIDAKRGYSDVGGLASVTGYLSATVVLEVGQRIAWSSPGRVTSARTYSALTLGREGVANLVVRGSVGTEGYQLVGPSTAIRRFQSGDASVGWRQWFGMWGGFLVQGDYYANDVYTRSGVSIGVFGQW